jgi:DNA-binding LacI/PurR family transcriptional regulator
LPKYDQYARVLEMRIRQGDYAVRGFPTEQALAEEVGVSRTTARRAMLQLMNKGLLVRKPHGKIMVNHDHAQFAGKTRLAFLAPAFSSPVFEYWRYAVDRAADHFNADVRIVDYVHWDDPVIPQTLSSFDGVFFVPSSEGVPRPMLERIKKARRVVVLDSDLSAWGVPSVLLIPPMFISRLADHLYELGHRHIDCLNCQPADEVITKRLEQWRLWQRVSKVEGRLIHEPVKPFEHVVPKQYEVMKRLLKTGQFKATGLVCLTDAMGAIRALHEHGLVVGRDVSVCTVGMGLEKYQVPSVTSLQPPDPSPYLAACMDWMTKDDAEWIGPLLIQPASVELFTGESTGPAPANATA